MLFDRLHRVADVSSGRFEPVIQQALILDSIVRTDGSNGYNRLKTLGYVHQVVRHKADADDNLLPRGNTVAILVKRCKMSTHQGAVSYDYAQVVLQRT